MNLWTVGFDTLQPLLYLPKMRSIASEEQSDPSYYHAGKDRGLDRYCIFKYSLSGEGAFLDGDGEHRVPEGSGFLVSICDPATAYYYPKDADAPWSFAYIAFSGEMAMGLVDELVQSYGPIYQLSSADPVLRRMLGYKIYDHSRVTLTAAEGASLVMDLLLSLARSRETLQQNAPGNLLTRHAMDAVRESLHENLNVSSLADRLSVTREHLTRVFHAATGQTPRQYIVRQKMLLACQLLKTTDLTCKEISARLGYSTHAQFARTFRSILRMPPGRFRSSGTIPAL